VWPDVDEVWLFFARTAQKTLARRGFSVDRISPGAPITSARRACRSAWPLWRYYRDFEPNLDSIRNEPEFKAIFADIERDMAKQRATLAARPKDAPLDLVATGA